MTTILSSSVLIRNLKNLCQRKVYIIPSINPISLFFVSLPKRTQITIFKLSSLCKQLLDGSKLITNQQFQNRFNTQIIDTINIQKQTINFGQKKNTTKNQKDIKKEEIYKKISDNQQTFRTKQTDNQEKHTKKAQKPSQTDGTSQNIKKQLQTSKIPQPMKRSFQASQSSQQNGMTPGQSCELGPPPSQGYYSQADRYDQNRCKQNPATNPKNICLQDKDNQYTEQSEQVEKVIEKAVFTPPSKHDQSFRKDQCQDYQRKGDSKFLKQCQDSLSNAGKSKYQQQAENPLYSAQVPAQPYPVRQPTIKMTDLYSSSGQKVDTPLPEQQKASCRSENKNKQYQKTSQRFEKSKDQNQIRNKSKQYPKDTSDPSKQSASFSTAKQIYQTQQYSNLKNESKNRFEKKTQIPQFNAIKKLDAQQQEKRIQSQDNRLELNLMTNWNAQSGQTNSLNQQKQSQQQGQLIYKMDPIMRDKKLQQQGKCMKLTQKTEKEYDSNKRYHQAYKNYQQKSGDKNLQQKINQLSKKTSNSEQFKESSNYNKQKNQTKNNTTNKNLKYKFSTSNKSPKDLKPSKNPNQQNVKDQIKETNYDKSFNQKAKAKADEYLHVSKYFSTGEQKDKKPFSQKIKQKADDILKTDQSKKWDDKTITQKAKQAIKQKIDNLLGSDKSIMNQTKQKIEQTIVDAKDMAGRATESIKQKYDEAREMAGKATETIKQKVCDAKEMAGKAADNIKQIAGKATHTINQKAVQLKQMTSNAAQNIKQKAQKVYQNIQFSDKKDHEKSMFEKSKEKKDNLNKSQEYNKNSQDKTIFQKTKQTNKQKIDDVLKIKYQDKDQNKDQNKFLNKDQNGQVKKNANKYNGAMSKQDTQRKYNNPYFNENQPNKSNNEPFNKIYQGFKQNIKKEDNKKAVNEHDSINHKKQVGKQEGEHETKQIFKNKANQNPNDGNQTSTLKNKPNQFKFSTEKKRVQYTLDNPTNKKLNDLDDLTSIQQPIDKPNQGQVMKQNNKQVIEGKQEKKPDDSQLKKDNKQQNKTNKKSSKNRDMKKDQDNKGAQKTQDQIPSYNKYTQAVLDLLIVKKKDLVI